MKLCFDSIEEVRDFVRNHLKNPRAGKGDNDGDGAAGQTAGGAPALLQPPGSGQSFNPGAAAFTPPAGGVAFNPGPAPEVQAIVQRINTRIDGAIQSGQAPDQVLTWFRNQCGPEAANATLEQIKTVFLPKAAMPTLENIAKLMAA